MVIPDKYDLLAGCSFTDPVWQPTVTPWSVQYSMTHPSYIVAKAGMGIYGICREVLYYLDNIDVTKINRVIIMLPTLWRMDIETDVERTTCNARVDLLYANNGKYDVYKSADRKWIISGGLHFKENENVNGCHKLFDTLYKEQGFYVNLKNHLMSLFSLIQRLKLNNIPYYITSIQDPLDQFEGLDYIRDDSLEMLEKVEYSEWFRFDDKFIDKFLNHDEHPTTEEHTQLLKIIEETINV